MPFPVGIIADEYNAPTGGGVSYFTGGTMTDDGTWRKHVFTSSDTLTLVGAGPVTVEYLVVAGGGGGGLSANGGGAGGAGGALVASVALSASQTVTIGTSIKAAPWAMATANDQSANCVGGIRASARGWRCSISR